MATKTSSGAGGAGMSGDAAARAKRAKTAELWRVRAARDAKARRETESLWRTTPERTLGKVKQLEAARDRAAASAAKYKAGKGGQPDTRAWEGQLRVARAYLKKHGGELAIAKKPKGPLHPATGVTKDVGPHSKKKKPAPKTESPISKEERRVIRETKAGYPSKMQPSAAKDDKGHISREELRFIGEAKAGAKKAADDKAALAKAISRKGRGPGKTFDKVKYSPDGGEFGPPARKTTSKQPPKTTSGKTPAKPKTTSGRGPGKTFDKVKYSPDGGEFGPPLSYRTPKGGSATADSARGRGRTTGTTSKRVGTTPSKGKRVGYGVRLPGSPQGSAALLNRLFKKARIRR